MDAAVMLDEVCTENLKAIIDFTKKGYGVTIEGSERRGERGRPHLLSA